jgi:uncharacterized protein (TIGR04222 family)
VAYLNGGPARAVAASLGALGLLGAVRPDRDGPVVVAPPPDDAGPLDRAVHSALTRPSPAARGAGYAAAGPTTAPPPGRPGAAPPPEPTPRPLPVEQSDAVRRAGRVAVVGRRAGAALRDHPAVVAALADVRDAVAAAGWLRDERHRRLARRGAWLLFGLAALGAAALVGSGPAVTGLVATVAVAITGAALAEVPRMTAAGRRVVADCESRHGHLRFTMDPSWTTYGLRGAAMAIALYGPEVLRAARPVFAGEMGAIEAAARRRARLRVVRPAGAGGGPTGDCGSGCGCGGCGE